MPVPQPYPFMTVNPHNTGEVWMIDINTRRYIASTEELGAWQYIGCQVSHIGAQWFDSLPIAD